MGKIASQSVWTTVSSYVGVLIGYFNLLWLMPYALEPNQIGTFRTIQDMALLLVPFAQLGVGHGITRFYPRIQSHINAFFTYSLLITLVGFLLVAGLFLVFKQQIVDAYAVNSPEVVDFLGVVLFITFFAVLNTILDSICRSFLKVAIPALIREVLLRLMLALLVSAYLFDWIGFDQLMWGLAIAYLVALLGLAIYMNQTRIFSLDFTGFTFPQGFRTEFIRFSLITFLGTAGAILIMKIDSLMVSSMIGLDANAIYTIGFSIAVVIEIPRRAISQVVMPVIAEHFAKQEMAPIQSLYQKVATYQLLICLLLFLGIWANVDNVYHFVPKREIYEAGKWIVLLIGLGKLSDMVFSVNGEIIVFSRFYLFNITATLIMCVAVVCFNLIFIPIMGLEGAALASLMAMFLYNLIKYIYVKIRLGFDPFSWDIAKLVVLGLLIWALQHFFLPRLEPVILDIVIRSLSITLLYGLGIYFLRITPLLQGQLWEMILKNIGKKS
ncbi:oligosaccharide flippase family protein [Pararhodonellum marinum]|uniref:oligosaccharide flippase family protein n=1 Tax=Pararhodonellum marinum TaxID=2755358 RepID=UPI00188FBB18|nr:oligosaccharide flippase family protein [Pararhodonellum marinum]